MVVLDKWCCCLSLRTGTLVIGWLGLMGSISDLVYLICDFPDMGITPPDSINKETFDHVMRSMSSSFIGTEIIGILMNIALLYAVNSNKKLMLLPWLITKGLGISVASLFFFLGGIACFFVENMTGLGSLLLTVGVLTCGIYLYIWLCVLSLYQRLSEEEIMNLRHNNEEAGVMATNRIDMSPPAYSKLQNV
ncbi:uncharacterized protein LOC143914813 [Arctopsyche grandis]|uniref:uncharacterized protein LOC143914813 n=1 Tax=Arctopsyche grandis TaxID=121162 RepID=UPI00406D9307